MYFDKILAIDPGSDESACTLYDPAAHDICGADIVENCYLLKILERFARRAERWAFVVEMIASYGMPVGKSTFDTCVWIGRFEQKWLNEGGSGYSEVFRREVKLALCQHPRAKDTNIRQSVIDRFGGEKKGIGGIKCSKCKGKGWFGRGRPTCPECDGEGYETPPGPLFRISKDMWASTAVALTFADGMGGIEELERAYELDKILEQED